VLPAGLQQRVEDPPGLRDSWSWVTGARLAQPSASSWPSFSAARVGIGCSKIDVAAVRAQPDRLHESRARGGSRRAAAAPAQHAAALGLDEHRIGIWAASGNVPLALWALMQPADLLKWRRALYGYMLDSRRPTGVAEARSCSAHQSERGTSIAICRRPAAADRARGKGAVRRLNTRSIALRAALARNRPITLVNHAADRTPSI